MSFILRTLLWRINDDDDRGAVTVRPWRRQLEAFTTDAKTIRLTRRRVAFFPTAAARQFLTAIATRLISKISRGDIPSDLRPCVLLGPNPAYATDCLVI